ncbi:hypothetical protein, partial [Azospirillum sp. B4]|uniref:hypothetical protein n=1 Tax=Azospirillum sp. B4 TaxID=95605 RepID=UPI0005C7E893
MGERTASDAESEGAWIPMFTLPLVDLDPKVVIEVPGLALVSADDARVRDLAQRHPRFATYLGAFTTEFGQAVTPSVLIRHSTSPETYRSVEALAGFRDAVALSVVPYAWALTLRHGAPLGIRYANWFNFYPWMTDQAYEVLLMRSMAQHGHHPLVEELKPQVLPGFAPMLITGQMVDRPLLDALLNRWQQRFGLSPPSHDQVALFRALNMAQAAAQAPGNVE